MVQALLCKSLIMIEVWMEGYAATGESGEAQKLGEYDVATFDEAVDLCLESHPDSVKVHHRSVDGHHTIWGCGLYDNEQDARKSFG
jgi:hypothetical protein